MLITEEWEILFLLLHISQGEKEMFCEKRSRKGRVNSESLNGGVVVETKHLDIVSKTAWVWV